TLDSVFECKTLSTFNRAFLRLGEIRLYAAFGLISALVSGVMAHNLADTVIPVVIVVLGYPGFEYALHRLLLHGTYLCKTPMTARVWWRIHYRHHMHPRDADVILAAPWTLIIAVITGALLASSLWWSWSGVAAALAASFAVAILYEYFHALDH